MIRIHYKARQELKRFLNRGTKPRDINPSVWEAICKGEVATMSSYTLACLIEGFEFFEIRKIMESADGWDRTVLEAGRIQGSLTKTNSLE